MVPWARRVRRLSGRPPASIAGELISEARIRRRVVSLAREIQRTSRGSDLTIVAILHGTVLFLADLVRHLTLPLKIDSVGISSYRDSRHPNRLRFTKNLGLDIQNADVLLVDDILDTGQTLATVVQHLRTLGPRRIRTCVFLDKPARRVHPVQADFIGFRVPDVFVVGYGMDHADRHRNLPFVGVLE